MSISMDAAVETLGRSGGIGTARSGHFQNRSAPSRRKRATGLIQDAFRIELASAVDTRQGWKLQLWARLAKRCSAAAYPSTASHFWRPTETAMR